MARGCNAATTAIESLAALGPELLPTLDAIIAEHDTRLPAPIYRDVLPRCEKDFKLINQLADEQQSVRRSAVVALAKRSEKKPFRLWRSHASQNC